jgi:DNA polymerase-3 subunit gamma/tau
LQGRAELALAPDEYSGLLMLLLRLLAFKPGGGIGLGGAGFPKAEGSVNRRQPLTEPVQMAAPQSRAVEATPAVRSVQTEVLREARVPERVSPVRQSSQSVPPWEALPPEADMACAQGEPAFIDMPPQDENMSAGEPDLSSDEPMSAAELSDERGADPSRRSVSIDLPAPGTDPLADGWVDLVAQMGANGAITALVRELAMQAQCVAQQDQGDQSLWRLRVERESLCSDSNRERLAAAMGQQLTKQVVLELEKGKAHNTPAQRDQVARERRQHQAEHLIETDPLVRGLLSQYPGARIVPGSIRPL